MLAEKAARKITENAAEATKSKKNLDIDLKSQSSMMGGTQYSKFSKKTQNNNQETDAMKLVSQKLQEISNFSGEIPQPESLIDILNKPRD